MDFDPRDYDDDLRLPDIQVRDHARDSSIGVARRSTAACGRRSGRRIVKVHSRSSKMLRLLLSPVVRSRRATRAVACSRAPEGRGTAGGERREPSLVPGPRKDAEPLAASDASRRASRALSGAATSRSEVARPEGLEPSTPGLEGRCSIQLSYGRGIPIIEQERLAIRRVKGRRRRPRP